MAQAFHRKNNRKGLPNPGLIWEIVFCSLLAAAAAFSIMVLPARAGDACLSSQSALDTFLATQPNHCSGDADCAGYYLRADSCAPAVVLAKPGISKTRGPELLKLQAQVREACGNQWSTRPACAPIPFQAKGRQNRCLSSNCW